MMPSGLPTIQELHCWLGGVHAGCYELFGNERVNAIRDLKRRTIAVHALGSSDHASRVVCKGRLTMEEIIFSLNYWRFVDSEVFELKALSQGVDEKAA